jgi:N-acyl-D-aspartate/D-glutamate deacylase
MPVARDSLRAFLLGARRRRCRDEEAVEESNDSKKSVERIRAGHPTKNSDPKDVMVLGFRKDSLNKLYKGKRLDEIARLHNKSADETMLDLIVADKSTVPCIFFLISEENIKKMIVKPYVSICSDAGSIAAEKPNTDDGTHPRMYGSFARFISKYIREEKLMSLEEGIRRMTSLPATNLKIKKRGTLTIGNYADVVVFDFNTMKDNATFENSHQYATGAKHVLVNGQLVLENENHTGAMPGRLVVGPGYRK